MPWYPFISPPSNDAGLLQRVTEVTYLGYVYGTLAAVRRMRQRNRGAIVQIGSALAYRSLPLQSAYCAAKHAIQGSLTPSVRTDSRRQPDPYHDASIAGSNTPQFSGLNAGCPVTPAMPPTISRSDRAGRVWAAHHSPPRTVDLVVSVKPLWPKNLSLESSIIIWPRSATVLNKPMNHAVHRPNNLHSPLPRDYGAHGAFERRPGYLVLQHGWTGTEGGPVLPASAPSPGYMMAHSQDGRRDGR